MSFMNDFCYLIDNVHILSPRLIDKVVIVEFSQVKSDANADSRPALQYDSLCSYQDEEPRRGMH